MNHRILIVEDHDLVREAYVMAIEQEPDMEVCGTASTVNEALDKVATLLPDVVLVDISLPGINGLELVEVLSDRHPNVHTLVISGHDAAAYARRAFRAGARGYVEKRTAAVVLSRAIRDVLAGKLYPGAQARDGITHE